MSIAPLLILISAVGSARLPLLGSQDQPQEITYAAFMQLPPAQRDARFASLPAADKAALKRTHARRWLEEHRRDLSPAQIGAVEKGIAFIAPDLYQKPDDDNLRQREAEIKRELACELGRERAAEAFVLTPSPSKPARSTAERFLDKWLSWFADCGKDR